MLLCPQEVIIHKQVRVSYNFERLGSEHFKQLHPYIENFEPKKYSRKFPENQQDQHKKSLLFKVTGY